ncbi:homoserine kinase [Mesobacillus zeae]|uniref:Homoserine kinase n=1 Tax=Mesobacillus zeae TaxID=1917180 RepID=A0A398BIR6_9BACI|nr:homoserine kinase [Mesobacillus zeae]RID88881.1 homoserine kinase [Mesobacillus zeae]
MTDCDMFSIQVPASSANLGPGFDSIGLALSLYLQVKAERSRNWEVIPHSPSLGKFPKDGSNFICKVAERTAAMYGAEMPACRLEVESDIPLTRGLGSSGAAIVAGVELADHMCGLGLSRHDKLVVASQMEGHPDNVGASLYGGLVVGSQLGGETDLTVFRDLELDAVVVIPEEELLTEASREVLPVSLDYHTAVQASAAASQLLAALLSSNWALAGRMMRADLFHHPYRRNLIPWWEETEEIALCAGAFGVALSGAGPTLLCLAERGKGKLLADTLKQSIEGMEVLLLEIDNKGTVLGTAEIKQRLR